MLSGRRRQIGRSVCDLRECTFSSAFTRWCRSPLPGWRS